MNSLFAFRRRRAPGGGLSVVVVAIVVVALVVLGVAPRLMGPAAAQAPASPAAVKTAGLVNGEPITEDQVVAAAAADLRSLDARQPRNDRTLAHDRLAIMHKALDAVAEQKLLAHRGGEIANHTAADRRGGDHLERCGAVRRGRGRGVRMVTRRAFQRRATEGVRNCASR